ncbi:MAG: recombinase family protein [Chloroflexi bacterium]|nr:recombinase family protein [Chloroflexota bacterium]
MKAGLYARVSTEEQTEGYSTDAQRRAFQRLCESKGWTPYREYVEAGKSAHTDDIRKRPVFKEAIDAALAGEYDVLVVHKIDRFSRKLRITLECFEKLGKAGVGFVSIENDMDYSTPTGKFMLVMQGGLAELYSDNLSQETKKGWDERKKQGLYCGLLPFGAIKGEDGVPIQDRRETESNGAHITNYEGLTMSFELAAQGKSDREIAEALNRWGHRTAGNQGNRLFSKDTVRGMLTNRFYLGELPDGNGGWIKAKHVPFVSQELWDQAQESQERNRKVPRNRPRGARLSSFTGYAYCWYCKGRMHTGATKKGKKRLMCATRVQGKGCSQKSALLEVYETQIEAYLENFQIPEDYQARILEAHKKLVAAYDDTMKERSRLQSQLERNKKLFAWGDMSEEDYLAEKERIQHELRSLNLPADNEKTLERLASFLRGVGQAWRVASQEQRNSLGRQLFEEIWIKDRQVMAVKPRQELEPFFRMSYEEWRTKFESAASNPSQSSLRQMTQSQPCLLLEAKVRRWRNQSRGSGSLRGRVAKTGQHRC